MDDMSNAQLASSLKVVAAHLAEAHAEGLADLVDLAALRLDELTVTLAELLPQTLNLLDALVQERSLASVRKIADLQVLPKARAVLTKGGAA